MTDWINPYIAGAPVAETRMFFGRKNVFTWIETSLAGRYADQILVIHGQRRVGKTSVLKQLHHFLPERYVPVFFDFQGRTHTTLDRFLWWLAREIVRVLNQDRGIVVATPDKQAFADDPDYLDSTFFPSLQPHLTDHILLLTFDEFDNLEESEVKETLARPLIDYLRRLMGNPGLNFIFSIGSSGRKLENMQASYTEFFKTALYKKISFLDREDCMDLIVRPVEGVLEYDRDAVNRIYDITSGHPYFTQLLCHELFSLCQKTEQQQVHESDVQGVLEDVIERGTVNLKFVWDEASDLEKWTLAALAQAEGKTDARKTAAVLRQQRVRFAESDLNGALLHLREKDVITADHRFVIYLLKLWLRKNRPLEQVREELTETNPIANRYIEIGLEFKDSRQYDKAIESFQQALSVNADNIQAQSSLASTYLDQKLYERAVVEFEKTLAMDEEDIAARGGLCDAHLALGDAAQAKGRTKEAMQSYQKVLDINGEHTEARQRMAEIHQQRAEQALADGRDEQALTAFQDALKLTPEDTALVARIARVGEERRNRVINTLLTRAEREQAAKNWDRAAAALEDAERLSPEDGALQTRIAAVREEQRAARIAAVLVRVEREEAGKNWNRAIAIVEEALGLLPGDAKLQAKLSALREAQRAARLAAATGRAEKELAARNWDAANAALEEAARIAPEDAGMQDWIASTREAQRLARIYALLDTADKEVAAHNWDAAVTALQQALQLSPNDPAIPGKIEAARAAQHQARLADILQRADQAIAAEHWDSGIAAFDEYLKLAPDDARVQTRLGEAQKAKRENQLFGHKAAARGMAKLERWEDALSAWRDYLAMEPDDRAEASAEMHRVEERQAMASAYADAQAAMAKKDYDHAIRLLKGIVVQEDSYKDASRLMAQAIELRRSTKRFWQSRWLWGGLGAAGIVGLTAVVFLFISRTSQNPSVLAQPTTAPAVAIVSTEISTPTPSHTPMPTFTPSLTPTAAPTPTATPTPTAIPFSWARLSSGQFISRDTVTAIAPDPTDPGILYVGMSNAGIYKTLNGGISWQPAQNGLGHGSIYSLVVSPRDPRTLYAGVALGGVYKTTDGGTTWFAANRGIELPGWGTSSIVIVDPRDSRQLFYTQGTKIYISQDDANTWSALRVTSCPSGISSMVVHPQGSSILFAAVSVTNGLANASACEGGIYKSEDGGKVWKLKLPLTGLAMRANALVVDATDGSILYAATDANLYGTADGGSNWTKLAQNGCTDALTIQPDKNTMAYTGCGPLIRTTDGGKSWQAVPSADLGKLSALAFAPQSRDTLWLGGQGIAVSRDSGASWTNRLSGLGGGSVELRVNPADGTMYADEGTCLDGSHRLYRSSDRGRNWALVTADGCGLTFNLDGKTVYRAGANPIRSQDGGKTWTPVTTLLTQTLALMTGPKPGMLFASTARSNPVTLYGSTDAGASWVAAKGIESMHDARLFFGKDQPQTVYAVGDTDQYRSDDSGNTWVACAKSNALSASSDSRFAVDPRNSRRVLLATQGNGILTSQDGCATWTASNAGLGNQFANSLALDSASPDRVYAGTDGGVYVSADSGKNWGQVNQGLLGANVVYSVLVDARDTSVYASTPYGVFNLEGR